MSAVAQILKNFNIYIDGRGYAGNADEVQLPTLNITGEDYRAAGMDAPIEIGMGMDKMEATVKISKWETHVEKLFGGGNIALTFRGALESQDGSVKACVVKMVGPVNGVTPDAATPGAKAARTYRIPLVSYSYSIDGETIHDIDIRNMKRVVGGVDQLAKQRKAIGL